MKACIFIGNFLGEVQEEKSNKINCFNHLIPKKGLKLHSYVKIKNAYQQKSIDKWIFHAVKKMGRYTHDP